MSELVLKVDNISKQYRLGTVSSGTLSHDLKRWWYIARGKEDPFLKIGEENDRTKKGGDYVWALKDISFEVKKGEVIGIIGKNGAGKSTLLKILSQVTSPSKGQINIKGRIAALLEVGTGFHPELTGRENIFLNGAILGMTKQEIKSKLDEIIDFSGVTRYVDTPVKRYSSGMMVRLGFAVAAHLEPEILIVDEVLAVGDLEFQKKCLGKMKDVAGQGRTILFVSHNMEAIERLCMKGIYLKNGCLEYEGNIATAIHNYTKEGELQRKKYKLWERPDREGSGKYIFSEVWFTNKQGEITSAFRNGDTVRIHAKVIPGKNSEVLQSYPAIIIHDMKGTRLLTLAASLKNTSILLKGETEIIWEWPRCILTQGVYNCNILMIDNPVIGYYIDSVTNAFELEINVGDFFGTGINQGPGIDRVYTDYTVSAR